MKAKINTGKQNENKKNNISIKNNYDVIIVGAGPAGIFTALELLKKSKNRLKIALIEMGKKIENRAPNEVMIGFGGAGTYSDGKLHFTPKLSHEKALHLISYDDYQLILDEIEEEFRINGVNSKFYPDNYDEVNELVSLCEKNNIELVVRKSQHVGTDKLKKVIKKMQDNLIKKGIDLITETKIVDLIIDNNIAKGVIDYEGNKIYGKYIMLAPGRINTRWLQQLSNKYNIKYMHDTVEIGVRVEFPYSIMDVYAKALYEIDFKIRTKTYDDIIRTFCSCPNGLVAIENYDGYVCVNGHSNSDHKSLNSNFAFVCEVNLTEPVENTVAYAESIARLASTIGGYKPIIQRLEDLRKGRRSNMARINKSITKPSLKDATPGDIAMALPYRIVSNILDGLEQLDKVMPGINSGSTLLYAPEVKYRSSKVKVNNDLETDIKNLFVGGDASGLSGSITGAAATGIMAARGILNKSRNYKS